jgi:hypothetical protein
VGVLFLGRVKIFEYSEIPVLDTRLVEDVPVPLIGERSLSRLLDVDALWKA